MHLESSEGVYANITRAQLARLLDRPAPLIYLHGPGTALVSIHTQGHRYLLMHWNGRIWCRSAAEAHGSTLSSRFVQFLEGGGAWREGLTWEPVSPPCDAVSPLLLPTGLHVFVAFLLIFGAFTAGVLLGFWTGRQFTAHGEVLVYVLAVLFAAPLAVLGQFAAGRIPSACARCGEPAITLQTGRFAYLCTECGHLNITRWGIHRGPMAP